VVSRLFKEHHCDPIYIEDDLHDLAHNQFLEEYMWGELHTKRNPYAPLDMPRHLYSGWFG
jgi:hypothetical protein